ncbi:MAG TPA: hypothetical protein VHX86_12430 [Tepidisphaeraceae bacterium]|jgi:hypothetical protein|nr:hypothetical protein [Tepidisphaeraceae bacterium]
MSDVPNIPATGRISATSAMLAQRLPPSFVEIIELRGASIEGRLGYFRAERFVIFGYCPGGGEVIWKDGHSSGFGTGGWRIFLNEIAPLTTRYNVSVGDLNSAGTHILVMDRLHGEVYAAPRQVAQEFLAQVHGIPPPRRPCLCALLECEKCPVRTCPKAGSAGRGGDAVPSKHSREGVLKPKQ